MKDNATYDLVTKSGNPLKLKGLIDMIVMAQTEHQYYAKTIHEQEKGLLEFVQGNLTNAQYYKKISNRISVDKSVGITRIHKVTVKATAKKLFTKKVEGLNEDELHQAEEMAEGSYLAYLMIMNSSTQYDELKVSLADDYAKGKDTYPKNRQETLCLLDAFIKTAALRVILSEGTSFASIAAKPSSKQSSEEYWKAKECYKCGEKGHPARKCPNDDKDAKKKKGKGKSKAKDDEYDNESKASKQSYKSARSKSSKKSQDSSFEKERAKLMANTEYTMAQLKEEYDISDCSDDEISH
jgi:Zinc knuckle